jgi:hypothetical protein
MLNEIYTQQHFEHIESLTYHLLIQTQWYLSFCYHADKGNNKITELRTILQRESQNS